ncbi:exported hypothetical protein [Magnetospirillum molischianum DSM 120]|uniref:Uncharacterized protein n=1 Tax=Magnetospirillum molischianum DSM 120 TaxID=1150626 RepID=H8FSI7_MAGML|nr:exported hypothetical protein [Magnetospirillum molischianum DSM 120]
MIEPLPKARSIWLTAASSAFCLSIVSLSTRRNAACDMAVLLLYPEPGRRAMLIIVPYAFQRTTTNVHVLYTLPLIDGEK